MKHKALANQRIGILLCPLVIFAAGMICSVHASQVRPVNLEEMAERAENIFSGECVAVEIVDSVAHVTLNVDRTVKGELAGTVTVRMAAGAQHLAPGEEVILFLYGEGATGVTSAVGLGQGKFTVIEDKRGRRIAVNGFGNWTLFNELSPEARTRLGDGVAQLKEGEGIPPSTLLDMVESLMP